MLLHAKANPLLIATNNKTARPSVRLDISAHNGHLEVVCKLIRQLEIEGCGGASGGVDALDMAARRQHVDIMAVLTDAGVVDTGKALRNTAGRSREASVEFLLQQQQGQASC